MADFGDTTWLHEQTERLSRALDRNLLLQALVVGVAGLYLDGSSLGEDVAKSLRVEEAILPIAIPVLLLALFGRAGYTLHIYLITRSEFVGQLIGLFPLNRRTPYRNLSVAQLLASIVLPEERAYSWLRTGVWPVVNLRRLDAYPYALFVYFPLVYGAGHAVTLYFTFKLLDPELPGAAAWIITGLLSLLIFLCYKQFFSSAGFFIFPWARIMWLPFAAGVVLTTVLFLLNHGIDPKPEPPLTPPAGAAHDSTAAPLIHT